MTNEEIYDMEIAPTLKKVMERCHELGFPMVASVEFNTGETGRTEYLPAFIDRRPSAKQLLVHHAARCHGNVDSMIYAIIRDAREFGHSSMCLKILGVNPSIKNENSPIQEP